MPKLNCLVARYFGEPRRASTSSEKCLSHTCIRFPLYPSTWLMFMLLLYLATHVHNHASLPELTWMHLKSSAFLCIAMRSNKVESRGLSSSWNREWAQLSLVCQSLHISVAFVVPKDRLPTCTQKAYIKIPPRNSWIETRKRLVFVSVDLCKKVRKKCTFFHLLWSTPDSTVNLLHGAHRLNLFFIWINN